MSIVLTIFLLSIAVGAVVGFLAGLLGIGGGLIIVPALSFALAHFLDIEFATALPIAIATSICTVVFTGFSSARGHYLSGNLDMAPLKVMLPFLALGAVCGAYLVTVIDNRLLKLMFACFVVVVALMKLFDQKQERLKAISSSMFAVVGTYSGAIAALMGIGGGVVIVPSLTLLGMGMKKSIGLAAAGGMGISVIGTLTFMTLPASTVELEYLFGYVYVPAVLGIISTSMYTARLGAKATAKADVKTLKRAFAILLIIIALAILLDFK